jgi:hypothetical protein
LRVPPAPISCHRFFPLSSLKRLKE